MVGNTLTLWLGLLGILICDASPHMAVKRLLQLVSLYPQLWRILPPPDPFLETRSESSCRCLISLK